MPNIAIDFECYKQEKDGGYTPVRDTDHAILGCVLIEGRKKPFFFDMRKGSQEIRQFLLDRIEKEYKRGKVCTIWAMNMLYDFTILSRGEMHNTDLFEKIAWKPFINIMHSKNAEGRLLDLMSFYRMRLEEVGHIVGLEKKKMPKKIWNIEQLKPYCLRDCEIVLKAVENLKSSLRQMDYIATKFTSAPKLAYQLFLNTCEKNFHMKNGKKLSYYSYLWHKGRIHQTNEPETLQMASRGGRIEQFTLKKGIIKDVTKLDVCSMYPFVCCTNEFPDLLTEETIREPIKEDLNKMGVAEVTLKCPETFVPYLPIRYNKVIYPQKAVIRGFWTTFEIKRALEEGYELVEMHKAVLYKPLPFNPFKPFMEKLYEVKKENKSGLKYVAKLLMNSLTGKLASRISRTEERVIHRRELQQYISEGYEPVADLEGTAYLIVEREIEKKHYARTSNPIMYAYITAYARDYLYRHLVKIPKEDLLYCVTDAIIFKGNHIDKFKTGENMGEWTIEKQGKEGEFFNEHYYRVDDEIRASGTKKKDVTIEALRGEKKLTTTRMITPKEVWKSGNFQDAGRFVQKEMNLNRKPKRLLKYPSYIEEVPESRLNSMFEEIFKQ